MVDVDWYKQRTKELAHGGMRSIKLVHTNNCSAELKPLSDKKYFEVYQEYLKCCLKETTVIDKQIEKLTRHIKDKVILDIGSGSCRFNFGEFASYVGYEHNPNMIESSKQKLVNSSWKVKLYQQTFSCQTKLSSKFDLVLFSHSLYGERDKISLITNALEALNINGVMLIIHRSCSAAKITSALDEHDFIYEEYKKDTRVMLPEREKFSSFVSTLFGFDVSKLHSDIGDWLYREFTCKSTSEVSIPTSFVVLRHRSFQKLQRQVAPGVLSLPGSTDYKKFLKELKNKDAGRNLPMGIFIPNNEDQVRIFAAWCYRERIKVSVVGGGHSEHCTNSSALVISMNEFNDITVHHNETITFGSGCTSGNIMEKAWEHGLVVPLGARPSVGCGMVLQGGIGHFARIFGLSVDNIVGCKVVLMDENGSLKTVSSASKSDGDLKWTIKGAGSNVGIVLSISMRCFAISSISVEQFRGVPCNPGDLLSAYATYSASFSATAMDAFIYTREKQTVFSFCAYTVDAAAQNSVATNVYKAFVEICDDTSSKTSKVSPIENFDLELYMTFPKGDSFKRCAFIPVSAIPAIAPILTLKLNQSPSDLSYYHFVHCGGSAAETKDTAFGCRDWEWAIVVTGLWQDLRLANEVKKWVFDVIFSIQKYCAGIYAVDLGPKEPDDIILARHAFGDNFERICDLKKQFDPRNLLACGCPILQAQQHHEEEVAVLRNMPALRQTDRPQLIIALCGKRFTGKDYVADIMQKMLRANSWNAQIASISNETKRLFAENNGLSFDKLISDRAYKEEHREQLNRFYEEQKKDPFFNVKQVLSVVARNSSIQVLIITGLREEDVLQNLLQAQIAVVSIFIDAKDKTRQDRSWKASQVDQDPTENSIHRGMPWNFVFDNDEVGPCKCESWISDLLIPTIAKVTAQSGLPPTEQLRSLLQGTINFPKRGIIFRDIFAPAKFSGGDQLVKVLLETELLALPSPPILVAVESGAFVFALMQKLFKEVKFIRKKGKLAPPVFTTEYRGSHVAVISSERTGESHALCIKVGDILPGQQVVILDDVLATGDTILACADLVHQAGAKLMKAICIAEFAGHYGKSRLAKYGIACTSLVSFPGK